MESKNQMNLILTVACSCGYKLVCVDDKLSKPFKSYLGEDTILLLVWSKNVNIVVIWLKNILTKKLW